MSELSKSGMRIINCPQAHSWYADKHRLKEPSNEELELQAGLALSYNAKGIMYFCYTSSPSYRAFGIIEADGSKRNLSAYGQEKYNAIKSIDTKLANWAPYIMSFKPQYTKSCIYRLPDNKAEFVANSYFDEVRTELQNPQTECADIVPNTSYEIQSNTYIQATTFKPDVNIEPYTNYFMILNRRCSPGDDDCSGRRFVSVVFSSENTNELDGFNNWKIIDLNDNSVVTTFDKRISNLIYLDKFKPAEGKLYKLVPVMIDGGTFVCDEQVINTSFVCKAPVFTGGYKLEILSQNSNQMEILFKQGAKINCEIGNEVLIYGSQNNHLKLKGFGSDKWNGVEANNLADFKTQYVDFENIAQGWTVSSFNCVSSHIESCLFNAASDGVKAININNSVNSNAVITVINNQIFLKNCYYAIFLGGSASTSNALFFYGNTVNSSELSQVGILMSNIMSVYVSDNNVNGFKTGFKLMECTLDLTNNSISGSGTDFVGINAVSSSTVNMGLIGADYRGGENSIYTSGSNGNNILLNNSVFNMDYGNNDFNVDAGNGSYNMYGNGNFVTNDDGPQKYIEAKGNCFNGEGNNAIHHITDLNDYLFSLHETPHNCAIQQDFIVDYTAPITETLTDTVYKTTKPGYQNLSVSKNLYQKFYKNFLLHNYDSTLTIGFNLLSNFSDSINSIDVVSKLYYSASKTDSAGLKVSALKTFYEQIILNNTHNPLLVTTANYFVQKCKVHLKQYTSALDGFQDIMVQNPYSYEGVLASWDYAATLLLANSGGGFSGNDFENYLSYENNLNFDFLNDSLRMNKFVKNDNYDRKVFTKEERKHLFKSVGDVLSNERYRQEKKVKELESKVIKKNDNEQVNEKEQKKVMQELIDAKNINSVVKIKRPKDNSEYQLIVNKDIEKLHPKKDVHNEVGNNSIPMTYALYQNYPNPFNPTTKIAYDLPRDAKVKLVIYDILGREMKTLVNNEFRSAGKYITEFNGSNLASGIYFARILVNEGKDFMAVKKMVLLK